MAIFSLEIPDEDTDRVVDALCANYKYQTQIPNPDFNDDVNSGVDNLEFIDNPETQGEFANRITREFLMAHTFSYETRMAKENAASSVPPPPVITDPST
jgi:hypothetical protein